MIQLLLDGFLVKIGIMICAIEYFKRGKLGTVYLRRIYGLDLEVLNDKTGKWEEEINDEWYLELDECVRVSKEEVDNYIENLFSKKITR